MYTRVAVMAQDNQFRALLEGSPERNAKTQTQLIEDLLNVSRIVGG